MPIKVLYDHQIFFYQQLGGISRYFYELINLVQSNYSPHLAIKSCTNSYIENAGTPLPFLGEKPVFFEPKNSMVSKIKRRLPFSSKTSVNRNENFVLEQLNNFQPDVFHPTYFDDYFLNKIGETPFVLTIYDMIHEVFPECFPGDNNKTTLLKKKLYSKASQVIAISEHTKKDIMEIFEVPGEKITVIPLANSLVDNIEKKAESTKNYVFGKYILFVGGRGTYKNFMFFIASISNLLKKDPEFKVVCTGQPFNKMELDYIDSLGLSLNVICLSVSDKELSSLYSNAQMFVFPSLYEGFGIPVLEAFACGCPALLSNKTSLPEVGGEAAEYFDPKSAVEIRSAVEKVLYDSTVRKKMVQKGYERLKLFSWDETVRKTGEVYKKCL